MGQHMKTITKTILTTLTLSGLLAFSFALADGDLANGKKLFTGSKCDKCHGTEVYTRKDRKVTSLASLESQVRRCDSNLNTNWFDDEIIDVTAHLNKNYYKF